MLRNRTLGRHKRAFRQIPVVDTWQQKVRSLILARQAFKGTERPIGRIFFRGPEIQRAAFGQRDIELSNRDADKGPGLGICREMHTADRPVGRDTVCHAVRHRWLRGLKVRHLVLPHQLVQNTGNREGLYLMTGRKRRMIGRLNMRLDFWRIFNRARLAHPKLDLGRHRLGNSP